MTVRGIVGAIALVAVVRGLALAFWAAPADVAVTLHGLRPIDPVNGHYELWAETADGPRSAGKFLTTPAGMAVGLDGAAPVRWSPGVAAQAITGFVITQERPGDHDARPSRQTLLRGPLAGGRAALGCGLAPAEVADATGAFLLDNPVTTDDPGDWNGLWFARYFNRRYKPGLMLYDAPPGKLWAGWVILRGRALRTGKFRNGGDNDDWAGYSGRDGASPLIDPAGRPMPGEDFITNLPAGLPAGRNRPDLAGAEVRVTLEDATLANEEVWPSPVVVFEGRVPTPSARLVAYPLRNVAAAGLPEAEVVVR